jgi:ferrous-iron efflux pump FieF
MTLLHAHQIADEVEAKVMEAFPNSEVIIHQDPEGYEEDHPAIVAH